uniref:Predicted protein n=1 Tax=Hordeum vulgare subsp. vulgare TaxID=112509 RepID=F2D257_HORVV|nr:predicted protein [Hordeum vulgare subsp. vulgare]
MGLIWCQGAARATRSRWCRASSRGSGCWSATGWSTPRWRRSWPRSTPSPSRRSPPSRPSPSRRRPPSPPTRPDSLPRKHWLDAGKLASYSTLCLNE